MLYRLYIHKSKAAADSALAVQIVNGAISTDSVREWKDNGAADSMEYFNADAVKEQIEKELGDKCRVKICFPPQEYEQKPYLYVTTSYTRVREVLPRVHAIAMENRLVLFDAETKKSFFKYLFDDTFINLRIREQELKNCILKELAPVSSFRKLCDIQEERDYGSCFVVTLRKDTQKSFIERTTDFYNCLSKNLCEGEKLVCGDRAFHVCKGWYSITFVLERYKKHADMIGYYENGWAKQALIRRMSVEEAYRWMEGCSDLEKKDVKSRMYLREMTEKFPNPADRFVNSIRITKWLRKQVFDIRYSGLGSYGSEILFHIEPDDYYQDAQNISVLRIEEESATFILPIIHEIYPYFYKRYYLTENHLPTAMFRDIIDRMKAVREKIVNDTFNPDLEKYIKHFNLYVLDDHDDSRIRKWSEEYNPAAFVYEHRYDIAFLYEIFIQWAETQIDCHDPNEADRMFNIQGP